MKAGTKVFGRLKPGTPFLGSVLKVDGDMIQVEVERCSSPIKVGKKFYVRRRDLRLVNYIRYNELDANDVSWISTCFSYKDLDEKAILILNSNPYDYSEKPSKKQLEIYEQKTKKVVQELKEKIQSEF